MVQESDIVREEINETRDHLTEKLVTLEDKIRERVENVKSQADERIESVRDTLQSLNPRRRIEDSPLAALGLSVGAGLGVGYLIGTRSHAERRLTRLERQAQERERETDVREGLARPETSEFEPVLEAPILGHAPPSSAYRAEPKGPSLFTRLTEMFEPEIRMLKKMAVTAVADQVSGKLKATAPHFAPQIEKLAESVKRKDIWES